MHLIKYIQEHVKKTPTCFDTGVPSSGSYSEENVQAQHANLGITSPLLEWLKY